MKFNFHEFRKPRIQRLFMPLSKFSFTAFVVPIKFRQPVPASFFTVPRRAWAFSTTRTRLDGSAN